MGGKWRARDFFILTAIGIAGIIFEVMQYTQAVEIWGENCSDALTYAELSQECKQFSDDMNWVLYELLSILAMTGFSLVLGIVKLGKEGQGRNKNEREGFKIIRTFVVVVSLTLVLLFIFSFFVRSLS